MNSGKADPNTNRSENATSGSDNGSGPVSQYDVIVIGAGIAGASVAARLVPKARVLLLEMESQPGYHTTGRSAALFSETYGPMSIRALTRASQGFFNKPPAGFASNPLLSDRGAMLIARSDQLTALDALISESEKLSPVRRLDAEQALALCPLLRRDYVAGAMLETSARDIDVNGLHQGFLRMFRAGGGELKNSRLVTRLEASASGWLVRVGDQAYRGSVVINAAGAWAEHIGQLAGTEPIGLVPKRRTALIVAAPSWAESTSGSNGGKKHHGQLAPLAAWPAVIDVDEQFYMKPDAGRLLISPADETPSPPCDAQPDELDIATCVDRIQTAFDLPVPRIENQWAGLRSFVLDKTPVCGYDGSLPGFFWLAGQGGYGIQSAPALSRVAAALINREPIPDDILSSGLNPNDLSVTRPGLNRVLQVFGNA